MSQRLVLPNRRHHITQKIKITRQRTLYLCVHDDEDPTEIFRRQNVGPLMKSLTEGLPQDTKQEQSSPTGEDSSRRTS